VQLGNANLRLLSVIRTLLASAFRTLSPGKALQCAFEVTRVFHQCAVAIGEKVRNAAVYTYRRLVPGYGVGDLLPINQRDEPLVYLPDDGAGLWSALGQTVDHGLERTELREEHPVTVESPSLRMRLTDVEPCAPSLPTGSSGQPLERSLPSLVQLYQELGGDIPRHVRKPRKLSSKLLELIDLVERRVVTALALWARQAKETLFVSQIPKESLSVVPLLQSLNLSLGRVDAKAVCLGPFQGLSDIMTVVRCASGPPPLPEGRGSRPRRI
jgi:hypothetical protein